MMPQVELDPVVSKPLNRQDRRTALYRPHVWARGYRSGLVRDWYSEPRRGVRSTARKPGQDADR